MNLLEKNDHLTNFELKEIIFSFHNKINKTETKKREMDEFDKINKKRR